MAWVPSVAWVRSLAWELSRATGMVKKKKWATDLDRHFFQRIHTNIQQVYEKMQNITNHQGNAMSIISLLLGWPLLKKKTKFILSNVDKDVGKLEFLCIVGGKVKW